MPKRIVMPYIPAPYPGHKAPFPLHALAVDDELVIPYARVLDRKSQIAAAIQRHRKKFPEKIFGIELHGDYIVTRIA